MMVCDDLFRYVSSVMIVCKICDGLFRYVSSMMMVVFMCVGWWCTCVWGDGVHVCGVMVYMCVG